MAGHLAPLGSSVVILDTRHVTLSLVGEWERSKVTRKPSENLPSSALSSASRKWSAPFQTLVEAVARFGAEGEQAGGGEGAGNLGGEKSALYPQCILF